MAFVTTVVTNGTASVNWTGVITTAGTATAAEVINNGTQLARVPGEGLPIDINTGGTVAVGNFPATQATKAATVTPAAATASKIVTGGAAVAVFTGPINGGYIVNPVTAADQGIGSAEVLNVDPVAAPGSAPGTGNGTTSSLYPGDVWNLPAPIPAGVTVYANAVTTNHKFTAVQW